MKNSIFLSILIFLFSTTSCQQPEKGKSHGINSKEDFMSRPTLEYYWDQYDFTDTATMKNPDIGEQAFVDFIGLLENIPAEQVSSHIHNMLKKAEADSVVWSHFKVLSEKYLYHPNSPMYNESYYEAVLVFTTTSKWSDTPGRLRAHKELDLIRKNNPEQKAEDFSFRLPSGSSAKMSDIDALHTVLFFYEPDCSSCEESIAQLVNNPDFSDLIGKGAVKVLAVYASGERQVWENYQPSLPPTWINAFDEGMSILKNDLYDLKASPTIYLLDRQKRVILKDVDVSSLLYYFTAH